MSKHPDDISPALIPPREMPADVVTACEAIAQMAATDVPRIPEAVFLTALLPALSSPPGTRADFTAWLDIAGTPLRAIDVVGNDGAVLFRVPPLMRSLPTAHQKDIAFFDIVQESILKGEVHPNMGEKALDDRLRDLRTGATLLDIETARQWNSIRARYNLSLLPIPGESAGTTTSGSISGGGISVSDEQEDF